MIAFSKSADGQPLLIGKNAADISLIDIRLYEIRMKGVSEELIKLVTYYQRFSWVDHASFRGVATLLFAQELEFINNTTVAESDRLDGLWREWADVFIHNLEDMDLSLDYSPDRQRFDEFLDKLKTNRLLQLHDLPVAKRPE